MNQTTKVPRKFPIALAFQWLGVPISTEEQLELEKRNMDSIADLTAQIRKQRGMA